VKYRLGRVLFSITIAFLFPAPGRAEVVTVRDATGEELSFIRPPRRIISLNPDFTENLFALGAGEEVIGVTDFCDYPPEARKKDNIGNLYAPSLEKIFSLSPDLVLATKEGNSPQTVSKLRELGLRVFVAGPATTFEDYFKLLKQIGLILGREEITRRLIAGLQSKIDYYRSLSRKSSPVKVFVQLGSRPIISAGRNTFIQEIITYAGGTNLAAAAPLRYPDYSREKVLADDPEVIIIALMGSEADLCREDWQSFSGLQAVRNNRVYLIDPDLLCRLSPRFLKGLEMISRMLHPEWFGEGSKHP
jgi:iron complex transport system substrate-binding protein